MWVRRGRGWVRRGRGWVEGMGGRGEAKKKHTKNKCPGRKKTSAICSLLQIAAPLANESLEGCASAIALFRRHYGQRGFKVGRGVGWRGGTATCPVSFIR